MSEAKVAKHDFGEIDALQRQSKAQERAPDIDIVAVQDVYLIMFIISTDHVVRMVRINQDHWAPTQLIGRTCESTDYNNCVSNQKLRELVSVNCNSAVKVEAAWQDASNQWRRTEWQPFYTDCHYKDGIIPACQRLTRQSTGLHKMPRRPVTSKVMFYRK